LVICPQSAEADLPSELRQHFREIKLLEVCHYKPQNRIEFKDWGDAWPVIYRPTELSEERARGLPTSEIEILRNHLSSLTTDRDAIIVDPITNEVNDFSSFIPPHHDPAGIGLSRSSQELPQLSSSSCLSIHYDESSVLLLTYSALY
jgi:hypothetical protein